MESRGLRSACMRRILDTYWLQSMLGVTAKLMERPHAPGSAAAREKSTAGNPLAAALTQLQAATRSAVVAASWLSTPRLLHQMPLDVIPGAPPRGMACRAPSAA